MSGCGIVVLFKDTIIVVAEVRQTGEIAIMDDGVNFADAAVQTGQLLIIDAVFVTQKQHFPWTYRLCLNIVDMARMGDLQKFLVLLSVAIQKQVVAVNRFGLVERILDFDGIYWSVGGKDNLFFI